LEGGVQRYFGFLRAVNVGGRQLKMAELAQALTDLGLSEAETFIASGNVVFKSENPDPNALRQMIEVGLSQHFGFTIEIFLRTRADLLAVSKHVADVKTATDIAVTVAFVQGGQQSEVETALAPWQSDVERFVVTDSYFIWLAKIKVSETPYFKKGYSKKSMPTMSGRNQNTIERMLAKWPD
jgi:uncharacterized protein (DUF1697 family)